METQMSTAFKLARSTHKGQPNSLSILMPLFNQGDILCTRSLKALALKHNTPYSTLLGGCAILMKRGVIVSFTHPDYDGRCYGRPQDVNKLTNVKLVKRRGTESPPTLGDSPLYKIRLVERYEAADGTLFDTPDEAAAHSAVQPLVDRLNRVCGSMTPRELAVWMVQNLRDPRLL